MRLSRPLHQQTGVSLLEVLVSIVIASIGLLALAGINASSVRYTKLSQYRATAGYLASDIAERMRANLPGVRDGNYSYQVVWTTQYGATPSLPTELCNQTSSSCSAADLAALDLAQWRQVVRSALPKGSVFLKPDVTALAADTWIVWEDPALATTDELTSSGTTECPTALSRSNTAVRCSYFRINL